MLRARPELGGLFDDAWDFAEEAAAGVYDVATSAIDNIHDAGDAIGSVLKFVSPIVAFWPGIGTALSVAMYAAGAAAAADRIDDAVLGTASAAMPPGLPRIGFDAAVRITQQVVAGGDVLHATIDACRETAGKVDPSGRALYAFDTGLAIARGEKVSAEALKLARANIQNGGTSAVAAFDASVAIGKGQGAPEVLLGVGRGYIETAGGPLALAAFDSGVALAYGKTLQEVGFAALQGFVAGNDSAARAVMFIEKLVRAAEAGLPLWQVLVDDLYAEIKRAVGAADIGAQLAPMLDVLKIDPNFLGLPPQEWALAWGVAEPLVRAAQEIARGTIADLEDMLTKGRVKSLGRVRDGRTDAERAADDAAWAAVVAANPGVPPICLRATDAKARNSPAYPDLEEQCMRAGGRPVVRAQAETATVSVKSTAPWAYLPSYVAAPATIIPLPMPPRFVPPHVVASIVKTGAPPPPAVVVRNGIGSDLALGGVVALAGVALLWWARG